jgi:hypothetical protein
MRGMRRLGGLLGVALIMGCAAVQAAAKQAAANDAPASACGYLTQTMLAQPAGPVLLASYPTEHGGALNAAAFTYDNALTAIALVACGQTAQSRRIADALLFALDHDRFWHDGRLRNGYAAGAVGGGALRLAGWWDTHTQRWLEDGYQAGSDSGNMAWAMLALLTVYANTHDSRYRDGALRLARWVDGRVDTRGAGGFTGGDFGHEPEPQHEAWKSTEHNTDLAAAFLWLELATGDEHWRECARRAQNFVRAMWNADLGYFAVGTAQDGVRINPLLALDAQIWPLMALPGAASQYAAAIQTTDRRLRFNAGYTYSEAGGGLWSEGTAQVAVLLELLHRDSAAREVNAALQTQRAKDGGYYASSAAATPTGFMLATDPTKPRVYFHLEHLAAGAWAALSEQRYNPFTGRSDLPR